jgi:hypothetical protein
MHAHIYIYIYIYIYNAQEEAKMEFLCIFPPPPDLSREKCDMVWVGIKVL